MGDTPPAQTPLIGVVEDDVAVLNSLEFALRAEGYTVCAAACADEARASAEFLQADCVVLDYALPDSTGLALLRELRRRGLRCPAIIIASNPSRQCVREAAAAAAPIVEKPLMGGELIARIAEHVQARAH